MYKYQIYKALNGLSILIAQLNNLISVRKMQTNLFPAFGSAKPFTGKNRPWLWTFNPYSIFIFLVFTALTASSCKTQKPLSEEPTVTVEPDDEMEHFVFDTMVVDAEPLTDEVENKVYQAAATRVFDLLHTKLDVSFDWKNQHLFGKAELTLTPMFYPQNKLELDAKTFEIKKISLSKGGDLSYEYNGEKLWINLDETYKRGDSLVVVIDYIAKPNEGPSGGSEAITSDKGLYFINPDGSDKSTPMQIWTQGETESSSRWFPTIDKPNERCTQEISITVDKKFTTLSNGTMVSSVEKEGGLRTDTWVLKQAHAPYLFMMAIGEYAWVQDKWRNIPLYYIVEPDFEPYAKQIYNHTPEMLEYFSQILNYPYPWDKFAQITAREYVSGAMENTTAVLFGDFIQKTDIELIDDDNDGIVAHEMFHHWFGDLVTCESWSNLTLNEGFANYSEYLWYEHKYGLDRADVHRLNELHAYLDDANGGNMHPLIHYTYGDKEDMFDSHSYNKGGLVLHMLRTYVGDDAFFASLHHYLKLHAFSAVEVDELRMAFEDVTGEDLHWFFDQWYLREGHPIIDVHYAYDPDNKTVTAYVSQTQEGAAFRIPFDMAIYNANGSLKYEKVWASNKMDTLVIKGVDAAPINISLDGKEDILAEFNEDKSTEYLYAELMYSPNAAQRIQAMYLLTSEEDADFAKLASIGLRDENYMVQLVAIEAIQDVESYKVKLKNLVMGGSHKDVRASALYRLSESEDDLGPILDEVFKSEKTPTVLSVALSLMTEIDAEKAEMYVHQLESVKSDQLLAGLASFYAGSLKPEAGKWFIDKFESKSIYATYPLFGPFVQYLGGIDAADAEPYVDKLFELGTDMGKINFLRFMSVASLSALNNLLEANQGTDAQKALLLKVRNYISQAKALETDPMLLSRYSEF